MLRISKPALRADFQHYYGLNLRASFTSPDWSLRDLGDLAVELPRGAQIWVHMGGPAAVTAETEMMMVVEFNLRQLGWDGKGKEPKVLDYPESAAAIEKRAEKVTSRAQRWKQRHMPTTE